MKLARPSRAQLIAVIFGLGILCGAAGGYLAGHELVKRATFAALERDTQRFQSRIDLLIKDVSLELEILNHSPFAPCSTEELAWLRGRIFLYGKFHDAGRMRDGKLQCSAVFERRQLPTRTFTPSAVQKDGVAVYSNIHPYAGAEGKVILHHLGDFYVIPDPTWIYSMGNIVGHVERNILDPKRGPLKADGSPASIPWAPKDRSAQGQQGDTLYVTRYIPEPSACFVAWDSYSAALAASRYKLWMAAGIGALCVLTLMLLTAFLWTRSRSEEYLVRRAIRSGRIRMLYQPIVDLQSLQVVGAEALARLQAPSPIANRPDLFLKIAERQGLLRLFTERVLERCLKDFAETLRTGHGFRLSLNITADDLSSARFHALLERRLGEERIEPRRLALEITEASTASTATAISAIHELSSRGHSVQIDDFGTGYSSLAYLRDLHVDTIKIDKSFTHTIGTGAVTEKLVPQLVALADALDLHLVVEGIETEEQLHYFQAMDRPLLGQGWLFGRPVEPDEFVRRHLGAQASPSPAPPAPGALRKNPRDKKPNLSTALEDLRH